ARSQAWTCRASASGSAYTATVRMPMRRAVAAMRRAISPRLAIRRVSNTGRSSHSEGAEAGGLGGCMAGRRQAQAQHAAGVGGGGAAIGPQPRRGRGRIGLAPVLGAAGVIRRTAGQG